MRILLLTHMYPFPPDDGGRIVTYNSIKYDSMNGNEVTVITFSENKINSALDDVCKVEIIEKNTRNSIISVFKSLFSKLPYNLYKYYDKRVFSKFDELLSRDKYDLIIVDHLHMSMYIDYIKKNYKDIPVVLRQHNVENVIMKRFYEKQKNILIKLFAKLQYIKLYKYESDVVTKFDECFMITDEDKNRIIQMNNKVHAVTIPAGVDIEKYKPLESNKENNSIVFLGAMNWAPNEDGVIWFIENVFEDIEKKVPDIKLYIVGKNPTEKIKKMNNNKNIIVTGYVEDEREYISKASIFIVPLRIGGGMRIKILNAMAMSKCIVSTSIGAEGIEFKSEDMVIANDKRSFLNEILELLSNNKMRIKYENNARKTVIEKYSWEAIYKKVVFEYKKLAGE